MVGLGVPLSSNNRANPYTAIGGSGGQLAGVQALNGQSGILAITGDTSIGITFPGSGQIQVSTAGKPQNVAAITASSLAATGAITGASVSAAGAVNAATVVASGAISAGGLATLGSIAAASFGLFASGAGATGTYSWVVGNVRFCVGQATTDGGGNFALSLPTGCPAFSTTALYGCAISTAGANNLVVKILGLSSTTGVSFNAYDPSTKNSAGAGAGFCCLIIGLV